LHHFLTGPHNQNSLIRWEVSETARIGLLIKAFRMYMVLGNPDALAKLGLLAKHGRYKNAIIEDARLKLEVRP
jgi:hypothetical protein